MGRYGAKYIQWAPFAEQTPDALASAYPKYGTPMNLGPLTKVTDAPTFNEAKAYGDNALAEYVVEFKECQVDVEITADLGDVAAGDSVEKAVNYLSVYEVVRQQMAVTQRTIERVAMNIIEALYDRFPAIRHVKCTVAKLAPPLGGKLRSVRVILEK